MNDILRLIADNPSLFEAVKAVVVEEFTNQKFDLTASNEHLGELTRARLQGLSCVDAAFKKIAQCKSAPKSEPLINKAR